MGISIVAVNESGQVKVIANSIVTNPIYDLTMFGPQRDAFLAEIDEWVAFYKPNGIIAERFQTRGLLGPLVEQVSVMLGLLAGRYSLPIKLITAATWKNEFHRRHAVTLDELYVYTLTTPHQLDSCFIGIYGLEVGLQRILVYKPVDIVSSAEDSSLIPLINKKGRTRNVKSTRSVRKRTIN